MKRVFITLGILAVFFPAVVHASVHITEIAWMGVAGTNGQYGEWFELYNDGTDDVDLSNWKLYSGGGSDLVVTLTKTIPAGGYLLVERTTPSMQDPVLGINDESGSFGGGGFSNSGEDLILNDQNGATIETLSYASGWPAGDASTKETMQWDGTHWITAAATPDAPASSDGNNNQGDGTGSDTTDGDTTENSQSTSVVTTSPSHAPKIHNTPHITLALPTDVYQYVQYKFSAEVVLENDINPTRGVFLWNMGDGTSVKEGKLAPIIHAYQYPGVYTLWFGYYRSVFDEDPTLTSSATIRVGLPALELSTVGTTAIEITNDSGKQVDLSEWKVAYSGTTGILPTQTFLAADASITIPSMALGLQTIGKYVSLLTPTGEVVASTGVSNKKSPTNSAGQSPNNLSSHDLTASAGSATENMFADDTSTDSTPPSPTRNRTRDYIFGAVAGLIIVLFILLERFMARQE
ncbi:MAG TPA: lamin tail domain-containing protein [Candidatus Paceibacterota bacterium]|nr:lamin tail domain-containing protein [Candidatus Paceibacterota bacterium]